MLSLRIPLPGTGKCFHKCLMKKCKLFVVLLGLRVLIGFPGVERTSHFDFPGGPSGATVLDLSLCSGCWMLLMSCHLRLYRIICALLPVAS